MKENKLTELSMEFSAHIISAMLIASCRTEKENVK